MADDRHPHLPVGRRLIHYTTQWKIMGANQWMVTMLTGGYKLVFKISYPPLSKCPVVTKVPTSKEKENLLNHEVEGLLTKRAVSIVADHSPGFWATIFLAEKKGGWRPVFNLKKLNNYLDIPHFKMETNHSIIEAINVGDWVVSLDLKDAYLHVPIHPDHQKYLRFSYRNISYQWNVLPFGLATSPLVFTKVMTEVGAWARTNGLNLFQYLDDDC